MTLRVATPELIGQRVRDVLAQRASAQVIALRAEPRWTSGPLLIDGRRVVVEACSSPLAVRATLTDWLADRDGQADNGAATPGSDLLVVLCDLADHDLGADVLARFTPAQVLGLEPWNAARSLFGVRHLDAAFGKNDGWIADALLTHVPPDVAKTMTGGGVLTIEVALDALASELLGADHLHVDAILRAAAEPHPFAGLDAAAPATRTGLLDALAARNGALGQLVANVIKAGKAAEILALGVAARAVYGNGDFDGGPAAGHLEARCGMQIPPLVAAAFATRCEEVVRGLFDTNVDRANTLVAEAAALATSIGATNAEASDLLPSGFERRITIAAAEIAAVLDTIDASPSMPSDQVADAARELDSGVTEAQRHRWATTPGGRTRVNHLEMAARLTTWLAIGPPASAPASFEDAIADYRASSAWVDRARRRLWHGDGDAEVGEIYRRVLDGVVSRRRVENERFAKLLATWTTTPSGKDTRAAAGVVAVEDVVGEVLGPIAKVTPLLFVVLDGCGLATFTELAPQIPSTGYREVTRSATAAGSPLASQRLTGIAALPTVTAVSRASLIAGTLDHGDQEHERRAFAKHPALTINGAPAMFFHQNALLGPAGASLSPAVTAALGPGGPSVVGVVINTIDDHLKYGTFADELRIEDLRALVALLDEARTHGRTVVISADHGHVLAQPEDGGAGHFQFGGRGDVGGERWRDATRAPVEHEVLLRGDRVLLGGDAGILAPFDDDFRYGAKAGGYHGGATPEEVLVPVAVFTPAGIDPPPGWDQQGQVPPLWWDLLAEPGGAPVAAAPEAPAKSRRKPKRVDTNQPEMFDIPPAPPTATAAAPGWVDALLASDTWKAQKGLAGRATLPEDRVRAVLAAIVRRNGVISFAALAPESSIPQPRLAGFLANLARVLNVEGYAVLEVEIPAQEVRLSLPLLAQQFHIAGELP